MKVKITDFLITMGEICSEQASCYKCPYNIETANSSFNGCIKDNLKDPKHAEIAKRITLERMKQNDK